MTLTKGTKVLTITDIEYYDFYVILIWGQYRRFMTIEDFNTYTLQ